MKKINVLILGLILTQSSVFGQQKNQIPKISIEQSYIDKSVRPQDDFYHFANGQWIKSNPVPASESRWGSFNELEQQNLEKLKGILKDLENNGNRNQGEENLLNFYRAYTQTDRRNTEKMGFVSKELKSIDEITNLAGLILKIQDLQAKRISTFYSFYAGQDLKNVTKKVIYVSQGGITLPNKNYYNPEKNAVLIGQYKEYIDQLFTFANSKGKNSNVADQIYQLESRMAQSFKAPAELRIPEDNYNLMEFDVIKRDFGLLDIETMVQNMGFKNVYNVVVGQPKALSATIDLLKNTDLEALKLYMKWRVLNHYAANMSEEFVKAHFQFYGTALSGKSEMKPLEERAIDDISSSAISQLLGKSFAEKHFSEEAKDRVNTMVDNILLAFKERIASLDWMSPETKKEALIKLQAIGRKLAYPEKWDDFSALKLSPNSHLENMRLLTEFSVNKMVSEFSEPVDKNKWSMAPHIINAYYHSLLNEIVFPAGIMQFPFFSVDAEDAVNYGRIGMVIGHEFTHGFDDMGSKFAADGQLRNWWTESDRTAFEARTTLLGNTFSTFCPVDGYCVNPHLTMGENIADLGGITLAYYAYAKTKEFKENKKVNGFTPAQRFYISYAQLWKINYTEAELKKRIETDPHSPGMYRVNGPLMNSPEFYKAFNVTEKDKMRLSPTKISKIW